MSDDRIKALQAEIESLRKKSVRRSLKQVIKDIRKNAEAVIDKPDEDCETQEFLLKAVLIISIMATFLAALVAAGFVVVLTNGLILLLIPVWTLYTLSKKVNHE